MAVARKTALERTTVLADQPRLVASEATDPDKLQIAQPHFFGDTLYWDSTNGLKHKIRAWSSDGGVVDEVDYLDAGNQRGAADLATDGVDLFWVEGYGIQTPGPYDAAVYFAAPYAAQPAALVPHRLTAASAGYMVSESAVGCGYAAHAEPRSLQVIRLVDGVSWTFGWSNDWSWQAPIALTCDEIFLRTFAKDHVTITRVRLDSLGAGDPPG